MRFVEFKLASNGMPIHINPEHVVSVLEEGDSFGPKTVICLSGGQSYTVKCSDVDVLVKLQQE